MITKTKRLYIRELIIDDAVHFFNINNNPNCIKYTGDNPFESIKTAENFLEEYIQQYKDYNMGRWAVCLRETDEFLGWCGLKYHPKENVTDIGYRLYQTHWNKGYATEATKACLDYGFNHLNLNRIVAHVHIDNKSSHKVALKSGLIYMKYFIYDGKPAKLYQIKKNEYLGNN